MASSPEIFSSLRQLFRVAPIVALAFSTACDGDDLPNAQASVDNAIPGGGTLSRERRDQAMNTSIVEGNPDAWAPRSCAGACGGPSPDRSCWCDHTCVKYGDCCSDYVRECLAGDGGSQPKKKPQVEILDVLVSGDSCGRDPNTGRPSYKTTINNFAEDAVADRFYVDLLNNSFELSQPGGKQKRHCRFTALVKWTPGHRVLVRQSYLDGEANLGATLRGEATFKVRANAGSGPGELRTTTYPAPFDAGFGGGWFGGFETHSGCSGFGYISFDLVGDIRAEGGKARSIINTFDASFRIAESGEAPGC